MRTNEDFDNMLSLLTSLPAVLIALHFLGLLSYSVVVLSCDSLFNQYVISHFDTGG